ncbi:Pilus assembly protein CpaD [Sphingomonas antarctica]|uniref:CpaD family pilus assembly protein n=1 Tax=Sphingomonas antarctica TaxID=2040274 RepID=UPI0039E85BB7
MRAIKFLPLFALTALAACGGTQNRGLESVHQPVVHRTDYVYDVPASGLSSTDRDRLDGWFQTLRVGYGDKIAIDGADAGSRHDIEALAAHYGLLLDSTAPVTTGEIGAGQVRVVVSRAVADVPNCPDWSRTSQPEFGANSMSNYGCAMNSNLAAMVANPEDLVRGRTSGSVTDANMGGRAIKELRKAAPTGGGGAPLKNESTRNGN